MQYGFITLAAAIPETAVADTAHNGAQIVRLMKKAAASGAQIVTFPELAVTGYTCGDLFLTDKLIRDAEETLAQILAGTVGVPVVALIGIPVIWHGKTYNGAAVCLNGRILGVVPKANIPNYAEFYELRQFTPAPGENGTITLCRIHRERLLRRRGRRCCAISPRPMKRSGRTRIAGCSCRARRADSCPRMCMPTRAAGNRRRTLCSPVTP